MKIFICCCCICFLALACQPAEKAPESNTEQAAPPPPPAEPTPQLAEDDLLLKLSAFLIAEPQTLADSSRNHLVNYAIDKNLNVDRNPSGLFYKIINPGEGEPLQWGDRISAHYRGYFPDGKEFDSSYKRNKPITFYIGNMIDGWNEGLQMLRPGGRALFLVPSDLGYGEVGVQITDDEYLVPPNANLVFEVTVQELIEKKK